MSPLFTLGQVLAEEESEDLEFKEVKGPDPISAIKSVADQYAVAFLNAKGGRILWGVTDKERKVVGVALDISQKDEIRRVIFDKLNNIQPQVSPDRFRLEFHPLDGQVGNGDLFIVELSVPQGEPATPYYASGHEAYVRLNGVNRRLTGPQLTDWIRSKTTPPKPQHHDIPTDPKLLAMAGRVRRILTVHGLEPSHVERFLKIRKAPFSITFADLKNDATFLDWLNEDKIKWIAQTFLIRREWIDGEDSQIHVHYHFDKEPSEFFRVVSKEKETLIYEEIQASPTAYFIRHGAGKEWGRQGYQNVYVVLAIPLARLSDETAIYRYISDLTPYPLDYERTRTQLRAWARLLFVEKGISCEGREIAWEIGNRLQSHFLHEVREKHLKRVPDWHPEDSSLYPSESQVAKEVETLPQVINFLRSNNLPHKEKPSPKIWDAWNGKPDNSRRAPPAP